MDADINTGSWLLDLTYLSQKKKNLTLPDTQENTTWTGTPLDIFYPNSTTSSPSDDLQPKAPTPYVDPQPACTLFAFLVEGPFLTIFAFICVLGNILTMVTLSRGRRSPTSVLFIALAVADMFVVLPMFLQKSIYQFCRYPLLGPGGPRRCFNWIYRGPHTYIYCYISPLWHVGVFCSIWITVVVTVNRYIAVCKPLHVMRLASLPVVYKQISAVVLCGVLFSLPRWFEYQVYYYDIEELRYVLYKMSDMFSNEVYQLVYRNIVFFLIQGILPLTILSTLTYFLIRALHRAHKRRSDLVQGQGQGQEKDPAMTFVLVIVVIVFFICQIPHCLTHVFHMIWEDNAGTTCTEWLYYYRRIDYLLLTINSSVNFFVFLFCSKQFRSKLWVVLFCKPTKGVFSHQSTTKATSVSMTRMSSEKSLADSNGNNSSAHVHTDRMNGLAKDGNCPNKDPEMNDNRF